MQRKVLRHVRQQFVGYIALFIALGGVSYAAATLPKNSVTSKQIKNGQVKNADLANNAVTSKKVKNGSLAAADFQAGQLIGTQGPVGPKGDAGPQGTPGTNGINGAAKVTYRTFLANFAGNGGLGEATASCNAGEKLIGGGGGWVNNSNPATSYVLNGSVSDSAPASVSDAPIAEGDTPGEWHVSGVNTSGGNARMLAYAICATP
jgi:hypothetical protein